jgi:hypothetical protein
VYEAPSLEALHLIPYTKMNSSRKKMSENSAE